MLKSYFNDLIIRFKEKNIFIKILIILLILFELFICFISFYKVNYIVDTPGTLQEASDTIEISTNNNRGHVLSVSVTEYTKVSLIKYWLAKADKRIAIEDIPDDFDKEDDYYYSYYAKRVSMYNAIIYAYKKASLVNPEVSLVSTYKGVLVAQVLKSAKTNINPDDVITEINGVKFDDYNGFRLAYLDVINNSNEGDVINFKVTRIVSGTETTLDRYATLQKNEDSNTLTFGFYCFDYSIPDSENSNPKFKISENAYNSIGNSAGAMMALSIYNALTNDDLLKANGENLIVAGTGTIDLNGNVGAIGAIEQKVARCYISGVDIFYVDSYDYDDAIKACEKLGYDNKFIIKVETFDDILNYLASRRGENHE